MAKISTIISKKQQRRYFKFIKRRLAKHVVSKAICRYYAARRKRQIAKEHLSVDKHHRFGEFLNKTHSTFKKLFEKNKPIYDRKIHKIQSKQFYASIGRLSRPKPLVELYWLKQLQQQRVRMQRRWSEVQIKLKCYRRVRRFYVRRPGLVVSTSSQDIDLAPVAAPVVYGPITSDEHYRRLKAAVDDIAKRIIICEKIIEHFGGSIDLYTASKAADEYLSSRDSQYSRYYSFLYNFSSIGNADQG